MDLNPSRTAVASALGVQVVMILLGVGLPFALLALSTGRPVMLRESDCDGSLRWAVFLLGTTLVGLMLQPVLRGAKPQLGRPASVLVLAGYLVATAVVSIRTM